MQKRCQRCGRIISTDDWYAYIRRKYCETCAADVHREQKANWIRELRRKTREENGIRRQLCEAQQEEIDRLRELLVIQRERNRALADELNEVTGK